MRSQGWSVGGVGARHSGRSQWGPGCREVASGAYLEAPHRRAWMKGGVGSMRTSMRVRLFRQVGQEVVTPLRRDEATGFESLWEREMAQSSMHDA